MKRVAVEWGLILSVGLTLAFLSLWLYSGFFVRSTHHFRISTPRSMGNGLHVLVGGRRSLAFRPVRCGWSRQCPAADHRRPNGSPTDIRRGDRILGDSGLQVWKFVTIEWRPTVTSSGR